jgi:hypothetical protein
MLGGNQADKQHSSRCSDKTRERRSKEQSASRGDWLTGSPRQDRPHTRRARTRAPCSTAQSPDGRAPHARAQALLSRLKTTLRRPGTRPSLRQLWVPIKTSPFRGPISGSAGLLPTAGHWTPVARPAFLTQSFGAHLSLPSRIRWPTKSA